MLNLQTAEQSQCMLEIRADSSSNSDKIPPAQTPSEPTPAHKTPELRDYQQRVISEVYGHIQAGTRRILIVAPTGSGKTIIASQLVAYAARSGQRVLFLVHRDVLVGQTWDKFQKFGLQAGFIKSGWQEDRKASVQIASVQTLHRRPWWKEFDPDVVFLDESHLTGWVAVIERMMEQDCPDALYLGLTATPWRLSRREGMGDKFDALVCAPLPCELIQAGHLAPLCYYGFDDDLDLSAVRTVAGDYSEPDLAIACDKPELIEHIVQQWQRLCAGRTTIAFAVNVEHSKHIRDAFLRAGITAEHVDGTTPITERTAIYNRLATGQTLLLSSCMALTEGFDVGSVNAVVLCRPTQSKALFFQMVGRGMRLSPETGKTDCLVLDQAGNVKRFGFIEELKEIHLTRGGDASAQPASTKNCPIDQGGCGATLYGFQIACPNCGYEFPPSAKAEPTEDFVQLLSKEQKKKLLFYRRVAKEAFRKRRIPDHAAIRFKEQFGEWPPKEFRQNAVFESGPSDESQLAYRAYLQEIAQRESKNSAWIQVYMDFEFGKLL
ncbi:DEAD/DEAH box helicase [Leptolyngbya sp. FACHB-261]|uniref:DEAD/DEAH box helicase n=1 Tax=Leptolyngbya sp. FACHB-261 TaxID=2692806 RepID=UPI001682DAB1|nr:DEAD/DEAH box helicase [Leptolyngbya sp. FACHB-261]MBD2101880.1 DEAD/DEAH box helicase [Leptolyngbya sp. FACHB-261]